MNKTKSLKELLTQIVNLLPRHGRWTPRVYDFTTAKIYLPEQDYWVIGPIVIATIYCTFPAVTFSTMFQIRNLPMAWCFGGSLYMANVANQFSDRTIQATDVGLYIRPNFTGSISAGGVFSALIIGRV